MTVLRRLAAASVDLLLPPAAGVAAALVFAGWIRWVSGGGPSSIGLALAAAVLVILGGAWSLGAVIVELLLPLWRRRTPGERWIGFAQVVNPAERRWTRVGRFLARGVVRAGGTWLVAALWFVGVGERSHGVHWPATAGAAALTVVVLGFVGWPLRDGATTPVDRLSGIEMRDVRRSS